MYQGRFDTIYLISFISNENDICVFSDILSFLSLMNSSQPPPPNAERGKKEIVQPQRRIGKAPIDEPMEEVFTPPSKGKNRGKCLVYCVFFFLVLYLRCLLFYFWKLL